MSGLAPWFSIFKTKKHKQNRNNNSLSLGTKYWEMQVCWSKVCLHRRVPTIAQAELLFNIDSESKSPVHYINVP